MSLKLFLLLALAAVGAFAQDITELDFSLDGKKYTETVIDGEDQQVVVVPRQGLSDHTVIMHDFEMRLTAFKDLTTDRCIVIPMNNMLTRVRGLIFKDRKSPAETVPSNRNVMLEVSQEEMVNLDAEVGEQIAQLCQGLPTFWARISKEESTLNMSGRRFRRWGFSGSASASTNGRGGSASGSVSGGSNSGSSNAGSKSGKGGSSSSSGGEGN
ncbi:integral membrane protein 2C-like [Lineus longissimus]|uniref:integral membrane protein 2C-like n=1 Tax=Lineus longissimus TaxID=88925 RepID=UPI002B4DCF65